MRKQKEPVYNGSFDLMTISEMLGCGCGCSFHSICYLIFDKINDETIECTEYICYANMLDGNTYVYDKNPNFIKHKIKLKTLYKFYCDEYEYDSENYAQFLDRYKDNFKCELDKLAKYSGPIILSNTYYDFINIYDYADNNSMTDLLTNFIENLINTYEHQQFLVKDDMIQPQSKNSGYYY
jgi:hypothetical protein